jgi:hypothetical protein
MTTGTMSYTGTLTVTECWCGIVYAIPATLDNYHRRQRENNRDHSIYCPLGHSWQISGESELDQERKRTERLRRQLANEQENVRAAQASATALKGQLTKAKNRAERGVCPHPECHRSFVDVARHVRTKHPEMLEC